MDKAALRERIWDELDHSSLARFPFPPHGRIPNFEDAPEAADRLAETTEWQDAAVVKANPDAPQLPVRRRALREEKTVYMAVPRLRDERCFLELDPARIDDTDAAATISGADDHAERVAPDAMPSIDLIVAGSVAVTPGGARIGKGEGYSDLEYAVLRELGLIDGDVPVATTVHDIQVVDDEVPVEPHDVPLDLIATPTRLVRTETRLDRPTGLLWELLSAEKIAEIPVLERHRP